MKKFLTTVLVAMMTVSLTGCGSSSTASATASNSGTTTSEASASAATDYGPIFTELLKTGVLKSGLWDNSPTFSFHRVVNGKDTLAGFEYQMIVEMANRLSTYLGKTITPDFYEADFAGEMAALQSDKIMFVPELSPTDERKKTWLFTDVYHKSNECYLALKDNVNNSKFTGTLKGVSVSGSMGSIDVTMTKYLYPDAEVVEIDTNATGVMNVINGKTDLACMNAINAAMFCKANPQLAIVDSLTWEPTDDFDKGCGLCMKYGNEDFAAWCNQYFKDIKSEGLWDQWIKEANDELSEDVLAEYKAQ